MYHLIPGLGGAESGQVSRINAMDLATWTSTVDTEDVRHAIEGDLVSTGFIVDEFGTTIMQIFALKRPPQAANRLSSVRLVASWEDRKGKRLKIELRSDEPALNVLS